MRNAISIFGLIAIVASAACGSQTSPVVTGDDENQPKTADVTVTYRNSPIAMPYVLFRNNATATDANKRFSLAFTSFDYCAWGYNHGWSDYPKTFTTLGAYLNNTDGTNMLPLDIGTYTVGNPTGAGKFVNVVASGFGTRNNCSTTNWVLTAMGTITLTSVTPNPEGNIDITLSDGTTIQGSFGVGMCSGSPVTPPANDPALCQ